VLSGAVAGDELTQTEELYTATEGRGNAGDNHDSVGNEPGLHVTEDGVVLRRPPRTGAAAIKRRSGNRRLVADKSLNHFSLFCHYRHYL